MDNCDNLLFIGRHDWSDWHNGQRTCTECHKVEHCSKCAGSGWREGFECDDGSFTTAYPCSCTGFVVTD